MIPFVFQLYLLRHRANPLLRFTVKSLSILNLGSRPGMTSLKAEGKKETKMKQEEALCEQQALEALAQQS
jgi:hypothetical protein